MIKLLQEGNTSTKALLCCLSAWGKLLTCKKPWKTEKCFIINRTQSTIRLVCAQTMNGRIIVIPSGQGHLLLTWLCCQMSHSQPACLCTANRQFHVCVHLRSVQIHKYLCSIPETEIAFGSWFDAFISKIYGNCSFMEAEDGTELVGEIPHLKPIQIKPQMTRLMHSNIGLICSWLLSYEKSSDWCILMGLVLPSRQILNLKLPLPFSYSLLFTGIKT